MQLFHLSCNCQKKKQSNLVLNNLLDLIAVLKLENLTELA